MDEPRPRRRRLGLAVVAVLGVAVSAAVAWRLDRGAIGLAFLVPAVERALSRPGSFTVRIGGAELAWDVRDRRIALRAREVHVLGPTGDAVASVPAVALTPSLGALLHGSFAPTSVGLLAPRLRLTRKAAGGYDAGLGEGTGQGGPDTVRRVFSAGGARSWLRRIDVREGQLVVADPETGTSWHAVGVDVTVEPADGGIAVSFAAGLELPAGTVTLRGDGLYRDEPAGATLHVRFAPFEPAAAAALLPDDARGFVAGVTLPVEGSVEAELDPNLAPRRIRLDASGGAGTVAIPAFFATPVAVRAIGVSVSFDAMEETVALDRASVDLADGRVEIDGRLDGAGAHRRVEVSATLDRLPAAAFATYWPKELASPARGWVTTRITAGTVRGVAFRLTGRLDGGHLADVEVNGSLGFDALGVRYLDGMPPARDVSGAGSFTRDRWTFRVARGAVSELAISNATVDLDLARQRGTIRAAVTAPARAALAVLQQAGPSLQLGIDASAVGGEVTGDVGVDVPLRGVVRPADVRIAVSATARAVAIASVFRGWSFSDGDIAVECAGPSVRVTGQGRVEGAPVKLDVRTALEGGAPDRRVDVTARLDSATRAALGFDVRPFVEGPVEMTVRLVDRGENGSLDVTADLSPATVTVPVLAVAKPPGAAGTAEAHVALTRGKPTAIERFAFSAGGAAVTGSAELTEGTRIGSLGAKATIAPRDAVHRAGHLALTVRPASGGHDFDLTSDDAGALFRAFGGGADATGGALRYAGTVDVAAAGTPIGGRLEVRDFTLRRSPLLARLTTLSSLTGIADVLKKRGVRFDRLEARIANLGTTVTIDDGVASGPSMTLLMSGTIDRGDWTTALRGTLAPSYYGLNTTAGRVPVVGKVITGESGAVQAFEFEVSGPLSEPRVRVAPLRSVVPGALRDAARRGPAVRR